MGWVAETSTPTLLAGDSLGSILHASARASAQRLHSHPSLPSPHVCVPSLGSRLTQTALPTLAERASRYRADIKKFEQLVEEMQTFKDNILKKQAAVRTELEQRGPATPLCLCTQMQCVQGGSLPPPRPTPPPPHARPLIAPMALPHAPCLGQMLLDSRDEGVDVSLRCVFRGGWTDVGCFSHPSPLTHTRCFLCLLFGQTLTLLPRGSS